VLDADKEGFLRSARSLIQTSGRAARNVNGTVIMYADRTTPSMQQAIDETDRRRTIQIQFNADHGIVPQSIKKTITGVFDNAYVSEASSAGKIAEPAAEWHSLENAEQTIVKMEKEMQRAARDLDFERAAELRDRIKQLKRKLMYEA